MIIPQRAASVSIAGMGGTGSCCGVPGSSHPFLQDGSDSEHSSDTGLGSERGSDASAVGEHFVPHRVTPSCFPYTPREVGVHPALHLPPLPLSLEVQKAISIPSISTPSISTGDSQAGIPGTWSCGQLCQPAAPVLDFQLSPSFQM